MVRRASLVLALVALLAVSSVAQAAQPLKGTAGSSGLGDPYYPDDGNGGYDVQHYDLDVGYDPGTGILRGTATITATATQALSRFDLDLHALTVRSVTVQGTDVKFKRKKDELVIDPKAAIADGATFTTIVRYDGVPETIGDAATIGISGFLPTEDGFIIAGEPHGAATWFPANDHPTDKATYTFRVTVPSDLQVIANGSFQGTTGTGSTRTWTWNATVPMTTYLATVDVGHFQMDAYEQDGISYANAIDQQLFEPFARPSDGSQFAYSQVGNLSYKRLSREITVPAGGGSLTFDVNRSTETEWDFFFVEIHHVGMDDWTTLPDANGHTSQDTGFVCPFSLELHPFLAHYEAEGPEGCVPQGTTGDWWAATGDGEPNEPWSIDLAAYAGQAVELSFSYASDDIVQANGVAIDSVVVPGGAGSTSFEDDGDTFDGWAVPGAPAGSEPNPNDWISASVADLPPSVGENALGSFARQPDMLDFLASQYGAYPFDDAGGITGTPDIGFALETQTRPVYSKDFFSQPGSGDFGVLHENSHQWFGDSVSVADWAQIWLNEGFATYSEWLWSEHDDQGTAQENFDFWYGLFADDDSFWTVVIGDPGPDLQFDFAIYIRGGMTLHQLRLAVGDDTFFDIMRTWAADHANGNVTTDEFIALAEAKSGQDLGDLFETWLFTPSKPDIAALSALSARRQTASANAHDLRRAPAAAKSLISQHGASWRQERGH